MHAPTATIHLRVLGQELSAAVQLPDEDMTPQALLPVAYALADALVGSAITAAAAAGSPISCRKGCSACCRQLVLVAPLEAHALADLVAQLPPERQTRVRARFQHAIGALRAAGMVPPDAPDHAPILTAAFAVTRARAMEAWLDAYFDLHLDCPFLEEDACSIYDQRPALCREYVVTTPAENCAAVGRLPTATVEVPLLISRLLLDFGNSAGASTPRTTAPPQPARAGKIPLPFALAWSRAQGEDRPAAGNPAQLLTQLLQLLDAQALTPFATRDSHEVGPPP